MELTLTQPRTYLEIELNSENKQLNKSKILLDTLDNGFIHYSLGMVFKNF